MSAVTGTRRSQRRNVENNDYNHQQCGGSETERGAASTSDRGSQAGHRRSDGHRTDHGNNKDGEGDDVNNDKDEDGADDDDDDDDDDDEGGEDEEEEEDDEDEDEDGAGDGEEEEDDSPFKFLERLDPNWLNRRPTSSETLPTLSDNRDGGDTRTPAAGAEDAEFYAAMIQMLTHVLGSSDSLSWPNQATPGSQLAPSPFGHAYSSPAHTPNHALGSLSVSSLSGANTNRSELSALQPLIQALIARLGKDQQLPRRPVGEQDLTALLQTLMEQQQRQQEQHVHKQNASAPSADVYPTNSQPLTQSNMLAHVSSPTSSHPPDHGSASHSAVAHNAYQALHFADLDFEDEDEDDPDFNPDLNPDLPLPSAWSLAVRDVVASERSRAAAAAAAAASHSGTPSGAQTPADARQQDSYRANQQQSSGQSTVPSFQSTEARRTSVVEEAAQSYPQASLARPPSRMHAASVAPGNTVEAHAPGSLSMHVSGTASSTATPGEGRHASDMLFSPSGRSVRTSRKRLGSPDRALQIACMSADEAGPRNTVSSSRQSEAEANLPRKRGRKPILEPGEAQRRRAQRNVEYQRMRRQIKKAEESEQSEAVLELKAEVKVLRAEIERLREENAMLRAQRELDRLQRSSQR